MQLRGLRDHSARHYPPQRQHIPNNSAASHCRLYRRCKTVVRSRSEASPGEEGPIVKAGISLVTAVLGVVQPGEKLADTPARQKQVATRAKDVQDVRRFVREDFEHHAYFVTGDIHEAIYATDCYFADPTVSFAGLQKWKRNLQLLVPFLVQPRIELLGSIEEIAGQSPQLKAKWRLMTHLKLPWRPFIDVIGSTDYFLNASGTQIVRHIEAWEISGLQAIGQMFRPSRSALS